MTTTLFSEELFQYIWDNLRDLIFTLDGDGFITSLSREFETLTGWPREKWMGKHFLDIVYPEDSEIVKEGFNATIRGETPPPYSARVPTKDGSIIVLEAKATPQLTHGKITGYLGIARDITDRNRMEDALRASEEQYRTVINAIGDPLHVIDREHKITLTNQAFYPWLRGLKLNPVIVGKKVTDAFPFLPKTVQTEYQSVFKNGKVIVTEERTKIRGVIYITETKKIPIFNKDKTEVMQVLTIIRDITESKFMEKKVQESEERLRGFMDAATDAFSIWDSDLRLLDVNPLGLEKFMNGIKKEEILGKHIADFHTDPEDIQYYKQVLETGQSFIADRIGPPHKYGDIVVSQKAFKMGEEMGIITTDITDRKKMEEELRKSEEMLREFLDAATESFSLWDSNLNLVLTNRTSIELAKKAFDIKLSLGVNIEEFLTHPTNIVDYKQVLETGKSSIVERTVPSKLFGDVRFSLKAFKVGDGLGLVTTDVTEQKMMEEELRENEEKFRSIFEKAPIGMSLTNLNFQYSKVNAVFCNMVGYSEHELCQLTFPEITHPDHAKRDVKFAEQLIEGKISVYETEKQYIKKSKESFWARITVTLLRNEKGEPAFFLAMTEDISALKEKEEELKSQLLKFKIEDGKMYLIKEKMPRLSRTVFEDLTNIGYNGFIVSRTPKKDFNNHIEEKTVFFQLTEKNNFEALLNAMQKTPQKSVFLFDRLEYLFLKEGFRKVVNFIFELNELIYYNNLVVLMSVDSSTLSEKEISILEKETYPLIPRFIAKISEEFLVILKYIFSQNSVGVKPSYSDVGEELEISRPTARKRIKHLVSRGYLIEHQTGKSKFLELSGKGELLFLT
ncbi:MAG: PAS domain S-box protein [Candidatus Hodarchaeales archaeon]